ncbi:hypothetical protein AB6A40_004892 [Gnathostoma spinigerum]|uniref:Major facilitator superfamily (MFS) profile domain-containing protein n=1 Tax=Gnathostoma spinigerum TaxID=75299 RepID=A0ABD6EE03_9BILA
MFGMGVSYGILIDASMTLACETAGKRYRISQTLAFQWSLAMQICSLVAYLTGSWRLYLIAINLLASPMLVLMIFWVESPRWLIQKKRYQEAAISINVMCKWNRCRKRFVSNDLLFIKVGNEENEGFLSVMSLVSTRNLRLYSIVMFFSALCVEMCVAVVLFDIQVLAGNPFINVALYGLLRIWVPFFIILLEANSDKFGRRLLFILSQSVTVFCFFAAVFLSFLPQTYGIILAKTCLVMAGGITNSSIFFTIYKQYVMELYPTVIRALAVGVFGVIERIGGAIAPQLINVNHWTFSGAAMMFAAIITAVSLITGWLILPETRNRSMPDFLEQAEKRKFDENQAGDDDNSGNVS